jgi:hypothetical protein
MASILALGCREWRSVPLNYNQLPLAAALSQRRFNRLCESVPLNAQAVTDLSLERSRLERSRWRGGRFACPGSAAKATNSLERFCPTLSMAAAVRLARRVVSHDRYGPNPHRRHRCHHRDDGHQRSWIRHGQMEDREPFCFLVAALSR